MIHVVKVYVWWPSRALDVEVELCICRDECMKPLNRLQCRMHEKFPPGGAKIAQIPMGTTNRHRH